MAIDALINRDFPLIQACLTFAALFIAINLAVDLLVTLLDPRLRHGLSLPSSVRCSVRRDGSPRSGRRSEALDRRDAGGRSRLVALLAPLISPQNPIDRI